MTENRKGVPVQVSAPENDRRKTIWQEHARTLLRGEMARYDYSYKELARALGEGDTEQSLITKVNRGTFSVAFFLHALRAMGTRSIDIAHLPTGAHPRRR